MDDMAHTSSYDELFTRFWQHLLDEFRSGTRWVYSPLHVGPGVGNTRCVKHMDDGMICLLETKVRSNNTKANCCKCSKDKLWEEFRTVFQDPQKPLPIKANRLRARYGVDKSWFVNWVEFKRDLFERFKEFVAQQRDTLVPEKQGEDASTPYPTITEPVGSFQFVPGCSIKPSVTVASLPQRELDIQLRHNELQRALYEYLKKRYGEGEVGTELETGIGTRVDAVVRHGEHYWFYEIKTALSARACIREAMAQLLEYSFWPGAQEAKRLIIVSEAMLDADARTFLARLRDRFSLPIYYPRQS